MKLKLLAILTVILLGLSCGGGGEGENVVLPTVAVKTDTAELGSINITRQFTGGLTGTEQADVFIRVSEAVLELPFQEGDEVEQGETIIRLDRGGATSRYYQAEAAYENASKNYKKMKALYQDGAISESQFNDAETAFEVAQADFRAAREMVDITAPISGRLVDLNVEIGDVPIVGTLAARIAKTDSLRMSFGVPAEIIKSFRKGMEGHLEAAYLPEPVRCTVTEVARAAVAATRTFTVGVVVPNPQDKLQAGMFAKATFVIDSRDSVIAVDRNALQSTEGLYELFVVENDTAYARRVEIGIVNDIHTEIRQGIQPGEEYVVLGQAFLSDGYPIVRSKGEVDDSI